MKIEESKSECDQGLAVDRRLPRAIAHIFLAAGLTANRLTLTGAIVCCFSGVMAAMNLPLAAIGSVFFVGSSFDALDGFVARAVVPTNRNGGAFLDTLADKIGESALLLGFAVRYQGPSLLRWL